MSLPGDASRFTQLYNVLPVSPELRSPFFLHALYFYFYPRMQTRTQADSPHNDCRGQRSSKTKNLCSKCFADIQKKQPSDVCAPKASSSSSSSQSDIFCNETSDGISQSLISMANSSEDPLPTDTGAAPIAVQDGAPNSETVLSSLSTPTKRSFESASESESDVSPEKRMRVDEVQEEEEPPSLSSSLSASPASSSSSRSGSKHRSRKRCHRCQTKLELVQQELGSCRCGYVFCMLHRLPEQHECLFDHLGRGRQEAVLKMVKLDRKVGRSCQRIGEECS
ncbi:AN1-type zinc finger protein 3 isoform X1 [Gouania willdenowi]|uniref:AN1-type zinc finger protein 3 isoform X1 n=1 Tax=Gouania willdenowi TaxID=441366 RepID=UPI001055205F|nr:AN1-type zinc finger protein 3-like isoform X1 [Gouania willdenowi]